MKIQQLIKATQKPNIYTKGTAQMWVDEYISKHLLETHLNPDIELASRKETTINLTLDWILDSVPTMRLNILDLGCGPGLYTEKLAQKGHKVTGMDFSATSIAHAKQSASRKNLNISYIQQDYLKLDTKNQYDLVMMIFTDFGVLMPDQREIILKNIYLALKPGGIFLFDILNDNYPARETGSKAWEISPRGFWRDKPYLALTESFYYEDEKVLLNQHTIVEDTGRIDVYRFWAHTFSHDDLENILAKNDFGPTSFYENILPGCDLYRSEDVTFCITKKE